MPLKRTFQICSLPHKSSPSEVLVFSWLTCNSTGNTERLKPLLHLDLRPFSAKLGGQNRLCLDKCQMLILKKKKFLRNIYCSFFFSDVLTAQTQEQEHACIQTLKDLKCTHSLGTSTADSRTESEALYPGALSAHMTAFCQVSNWILFFKSVFRPPVAA